MSFFTGLLPVLDAARAIPQSLGLRTSRVWIRSKVWSAGAGVDEVGKGTLVTTDTEIIPRPRVRELVGERFSIGPITPSHSTGGYAPTDLLPSDAAGEDHIIAIQTPDGTTREYQITRIQTEPNARSFSYYVEVEPLQRAAPY